MALRNNLMCLKWPHKWNVCDVISLHKDRGVKYTRVKSVLRSFLDHVGGSGIES